MHLRHNLLVGVMAVAAACAVSAPASAQTTRSYDLPEQDLGAALKAFAAASGREVVAATSVVASKRSGAVRGVYRPEQALALLLARTGLRSELVDGAFVIRPIAGDDAASPDGIESADIVVTGTRIRGGQVASPVIVVSSQAARDSGQATLGEVVRGIPQSFGGGQNPGVGLNVPVASGVNASGGSSINLRGLGSDATLTLLNGRRLSYSGSRQSVDVSTIPLSAVDRIELVPDGASALYGSDAVGGVANIILRRDMNGVEVRARIGAATEGGDFDQQYGLAAGRRWSSGGFIAAYEFNRTTAIDSSDRDYAASRSPGLRLLPSATANSALVSLHQLLAPNLEFTVDGLYNERRSLLIYSYDLAGDLNVDRVETRFNDRAFAIAPTLALTLGDLKLALSGSYAKDRVDYSVIEITPAATSKLTAGCYCNRAQSIELSGSDTLFRLPGGGAKVALGVGYRNAYLNNDRGAGYPLNFARSQADYYAYGEVSLPILSPANEISGIARLSLNAAARYERYDGFGSVTTPKIGLIYAPIPAIDFKLSWGKSFRAPTLLQRFQPISVSLIRATSAGGTGYPAGSTVLYMLGGQDGIRPERATSWSATASIHPTALQGFSLDLSYFSVHYVDRIVAPITFASQSLSNSIYSGLVNRTPTAAQIATTVANAAVFSNSSGAVYNPASVVAIVDNRNLNAGSQPVHGIDALLNYRARLNDRDTLTFTGNVSYLVSERQIASGLPYTALAGVIFNPPHWRGRGSIGWRHDAMTLTGVANFVGPLSDARSTPATAIPSQATFDIAFRYAVPASAPTALRGLDLTLAVQNIFDRTPPIIATTFPTETPYDSTNYSPIGRFISLSVTKRW